MSAAIQLTNLSKAYTLGLTHHGSIRELTNAWVRKVFRRNQTPQISPTNDRSSDSQFWALQDITCDIRQGEAVGIIGKNGAGKSTLLKILSRITKPTSGTAEITGRIASLLEVGTGFHPELTGLENIYLNGTILGMSRADIARELDSIVEFSGVSQFLNTPVKRYSSGMIVRLGFAVAAHLNPEILIVDEVLAVGDIEFQNRCLDKMQSVSTSGKTVLFVSHNLASIRALTQRCLVLSGGRLIYDGPTDGAVAQYVRENTQRSKGNVDYARLDRPFAGLSHKLGFTDLSLANLNEAGQLASDLPFELVIEVESHEKIPKFAIGMTIFTRDALAVGSSFSSELDAPPVGTTARYRLQSPFPLAPGEYHLAISILDSRNQLLDSLAHILPFDVLPDAIGSRQWQPAWGPIQLPSLELMDCSAAAAVDTTTIS